MVGWLRMGPRQAQCATAMEQSNIWTFVPPSNQLMTEASKYHRQHRCQCHSDCWEPSPPRSWPRPAETSRRNTQRPRSPPRALKHPPISPEGPGLRAPSTAEPADVMTADAAAQPRGPLGNAAVPDAVADTMPATAPDGGAEAQRVTLNPKTLNPIPVAPGDSYFKHNKQ